MLQNATARVIQLNLGQSQESHTLLAGSWNDLVKDKSLHGTIDIIVMSETLYNVSYYPTLFNAINLWLSQDPGAQVIIGTKTYYFGLGGGLHELEQFIKANQAEYAFNLETLFAVNDGNSIERRLLKMTRGSGNQED